MSAVLKPQLETIFDHGITDAEMDALTDGNPETRDEYLFGLDQDSAYADLYRLYCQRGSNQAFIFLDKIQDAGFKRQFITRPCCFADDL